MSSTQGMPSDSRSVPASEPAPLRTSKRTAGKPWLAEMTKVVGKIIEREDAEVFREPVDWQGLGLFDYLVIVKEPRDLGSIRKGLERGVYDSIDAVAADVRLVWYNCMLYNPADSSYYNLAQGHAVLWESQYRLLRQSLGLAPEMTTPAYPFTFKGRLLPTDHHLSIMLPAVRELQHPTPPAPPPAPPPQIPLCLVKSPPPQSGGAGGQAGSSQGRPVASVAGISLLNLAAAEVAADFLLEHRVHAAALKGGGDEQLLDALMEL